MIEEWPLTVLVVREAEADEDTEDEDVEPELAQSLFASTENWVESVQLVSHH